MKTNAQHSDFLQMISYATKAPSGHNTQPWLFDIQEDKIVISPNFDKKLPAVDGNNRELFMSLGCATENLCLAASSLGYENQVVTDDSGTITVHLKKSHSVVKDALFQQIEKRQTNRSKYDGKTISDELISEILTKTQTADNHIFAWSKKDAEYEQLTEFVMKGNEQQMNDEAFKTELLSWIRFNKSHSEATNDGVSYAVMGAPNFPQFITKFFVKSALNAKSQNKTDRKKIASSSHLVLITSKLDDIKSWIEMGRTLQRLLLTLTEKNIATAYLNQPCEVPSLNAEMQSQLPVNQQKPQILLRIGYAKPMPFSKRKNLEEVIKH